MIEVISATRSTESEFWQNSALGISIKRLAQDDQRLRARVTYENRTGLPELFNACINGDDNHDILVFIHDDVWIDDYFFVDRVISGLDTFDVIGVAGNKRSNANQPGWAFIDDQFTWDAKEHLSGRVAHGPYPFGPVSVFGPTPEECELLDGLFLSVRRATLKTHGLAFDTRFNFHFYDLDFCRSARAKGLRLGTWPICLTHQSGGAFNSPGWRDSLYLYRKKWGS